MPPKPASKPKPNPGKSRGKGKGKQNKQKRHKLNLKGWLKTAADWARFDAWAKVNALPRKIPEPEPIVREAKPLSQLKKRLEVIAQPTPKPDPGAQCRLDLSVSKGALRAKPSKRIRELAMFVWKDQDPGRELTIAKAALNYVASPRIVEMAKPHFHEPEICRESKVSKKGEKMSLAKRATECPSSLTDEEIAKIFTPDGIKKSALTYKITDWVSTLALPSYRFLKDRNDPEAKKMKKQLEESEERGKKVLEEQRAKEEEKAERDKKGKKKKKGKEKQKKKKKKKEQQEGAGDKDEAEEKPNEEKTEEEKREEKKRRERKNWRKEPGPCKTSLSISKAARNAKASPRTEEMAKPHIHVSKSCRENAFAVRKGALAGSASARVAEMAKPTHPSDPVERPPPREKNAYGAPIFPKPKFGKRLPKVKPYKMGECKDKDEKDNGEKNGKENTKRKYDSVPLFPSIDPCLDSLGAKKQAEARKIADEAAKAKKENKEKETPKQN